MAIDTKRTSNLKSSTGYRWRDKDAILDVINDIIDRGSLSPKTIAERSGVSYSTIHAWMFGKTRKPQAMTARHVLQACGYDLAVQRQTDKKITLIPINPRTNERVK